MSGANRIHETQGAYEGRLETAYNNETLLPMQAIESGGSPKRVDFSAMPAPIRYFGYFFMTAGAVFALAVVFVSLFR
ncbi:hypothetical protein [Paenibacillus sp. MMS18-CY102]|uniref:hypothetical protein n=1 Tax=Paenibacillus sp. MMS18-CY102 TaxID=2682849 RepID=UPI0013656277|nr:hypothetical protein [Paenibacillus sp. MMS18-CY102]MWC29398.1 hypothetical protein [Paenibacillus sp. MMS18-CY102]